MQLVTIRVVRSLVGVLVIALAVSAAPLSDTAQAQLPGPLTIDHYQVYPNEGGGFLSTFVILVDQFGESNHLAEAHNFFAVPANKNNEGINNPSLHYNWWSLSQGASPEPARRVVVQNQFGDFTLEVDQPRYLMAPALKNVTAGGAQGDHYKCYDVIGAFVDVVVSIEDQYSSESAVQMLTARYLCNPAMKVLEDGRRFPVSNPEEHLVCYSRGLGGVGNLFGISADQFGVWNLLLTNPKYLCVPSFKDEVVQTLEGTWGELKSTYR